MDFNNMQKHGNDKVMTVLAQTDMIFKQANCLEENRDHKD